MLSPQLKPVVCILIPQIESSPLVFHQQTHLLLFRTSHCALCTLFLFYAMLVPRPRLHPCKAKYADKRGLMSQIEPAIPPDSEPPAEQRRTAELPRPRRFRKAIIQMPCYNEAPTLALALACLPRELPGVDKVEWLVIDDGSTDGTRAVALANGVDHVVSHTQNMGLARAFMTGLAACVELGADIIVNTDADNQYNARDIPALMQPILTGKAEYVIGTRPIKSIAHFSPLKKLLQRLGSWCVRLFSGTEVGDAPSGFRAMTRDTAMKLNVFNSYTYTLETIIQAGRKQIPVACVPVRVNEDLRPSRLVKSIPAYVQKSILTILRIFVVYKPFTFFCSIGAVMFGLGLVIGLRFLWHFFAGGGEGMVQSLILAAILLGMGFVSFMIAFVADLLAVNRMLLEDIRLNTLKNRLNSNQDKRE